MLIQEQVLKIIKCPNGGMVYTLVLGTSAERLVGSSPT
jgi:hypothetical protein